MQNKVNANLVIATALMAVVLVIVLTNSWNSNLRQDNNQLKSDIKAYQAQEKEWENFIEELNGKIKDKQDTIDILSKEVDKYKVGAWRGTKRTTIKKHEETLNRTRNLSADSTFQLLKRNLGR